MQLQRAGFEVVRERGSHVILLHRSTRRSTAVPVHGRDMPMRTLRAILKQAGLTVDEFIALL